LGVLANGQAGEHGKIIRDRNHHRLVYTTPEVPDLEELEKLDHVRSALDGLNAVEREAGKSWYKFEEEEICVKRAMTSTSPQTTQLSRLSPVVNGLKRSSKVDWTYRLTVEKRLKYVLVRLIDGASHDD
jgi:uncharacterized protein